MTPANHTSRSASRALLSAVAVAALGMLAPLDARADDVIYACYVPSSGTIYRIKITDPNETCKAPSHVEFHWNVEGPVGTPGVSGYEVVESGPHEFPSGEGTHQTVNCPLGKVVLGGGYQVLSEPGTHPRHIVSLNRPNFVAGGWRQWVVTVPVAEPGSTSTLTVWAICASVGNGS